MAAFLDVMFFLWLWGLVGLMSESSVGRFCLLLLFFGVLWGLLKASKSDTIELSEQVVSTRQRILFDKSFAEKHLTKSLVGSVIQDAVFFKEVSAKDALEWLVKTDKGGLLEGYRNLPAELQNRVAKKICENLVQ